jgi:hypothetical protein
MDGNWAQKAVSIEKWKVFSKVKRLFYGIPSLRVKLSREFIGGFGRKRESPFRGRMEEALF